MFNESKSLRIPTEFTLFGHKYKVEVVSGLLESDGSYGHADEDAKLIILQGPGIYSHSYESRGKQETSMVHITDEVMIETFFHEVSHIILDAIGEEKLSQNERLVNMLGKSWLEIYISSKYDKNPNPA